MKTETAQGRYKIIYVDPERLETPRFPDVACYTEISMAIADDRCQCLQKYILTYFGEEAEENCKMCSNCSAEYETIGVYDMAADLNSMGQLL